MHDVAHRWEEVRRLAQLGQWSEAEHLVFSLCRSCPPPPAEWLNELGVLLARHGRLAQAEQIFRQVLAHYPDYAPAYGNLGLVLRRLDRTSDAVGAFQQALSLDPNFVEALNNFALLCRDLGQLQEARSYLERAVQLRPDQPALHVNLAQLYRVLNRDKDAAIHYRYALATKPEQLDTCLGLSLSLIALGEEGEAENWARHATVLAPHHADAWNTLGTILTSTGRYDEALTCFEEALRSQPQHHLAHLNRGMIYLLRGDWQRGWQDYEYRLQIQTQDWHRFPGTRWQGETLTGKTILLVAEQGLGDTLQFVRFAQVLKDRGARVLLACSTQLVAILRRAASIDACYGKGEPLPAYDFYSPLLSVPHYLGIDPNNIPAEVPYIRPDPELASIWQKKLPNQEGIRVGIAWQGNPSYPNDRQRSVPLSLFRCLADIPGVILISLQKGPGEEQLAQCDFPVVDLGAERDEAQGAFMDTAAMAQHLDLVICTDSAVAHLIGALGRPIWLLLGYVCDWRWGTTGETTPWYPTMRLFRQPRRHDWESVFKRVATELRHLAEKKWSSGDETKRQPILVPISPGELLDKITILRIKRERIAEADKRRHVETELAELERVAGQALPRSAELEELVGQLQAVNLALWEVEDELRDCERQQNFGGHFVELARSVYRLNDRRAEIKKRINVLLGSQLIEEKSYRSY